DRGPGDRNGDVAGSADRVRRLRGARRRAGSRRARSHPAGDAAGAGTDHRDREGGRPMGQDPGAIRQDIEATREQMGDTVEALSYKADVKARAKDSITDRVDSVKSRVGL